MAKNRKIYLAVFVEYDHYRFQETMFANTSKLEVLKYIYIKQSNMKYNFPIYEYPTIKQTPKDLARNERHHWWIQEFPTPEALQPEYPLIFNK